MTIYYLDIIETTMLVIYWFYVLNPLRMSLNHNNNVEYICIDLNSSPLYYVFILHPLIQFILIIVYVHLSYILIITPILLVLLEILIYYIWIGIPWNINLINVVILLSFIECILTNSLYQLINFNTRKYNIDLILINYYKSVHLQYVWRT